MLTPTDDGDGFGPGWYTYLEDIQGANQRFLVVDKLASWFTNAAMEGLWQIRIAAKDPSVPALLPGFQTVRVRIDNTAPSGPAGPGATQAQIEANPPLTITGATLNGNPLPAVACGKFPVGSIITGTYEVHDPGSGVAEPALQRLVADRHAGGTSERRLAEPVEPFVSAAGADHRRGGHMDARHDRDGSVRVCHPALRDGPDERQQHGKRVRHGVRRRLLSGACAELVRGKRLH